MENGNGIAGTSVSYNLDGYNYSGTTFGPLLYFRNLAAFSAIFCPISPLDKAYTLNFQKGFHLKTSAKRLPESGTFGDAEDTINIFMDEIISDINVYVGIHHHNGSSLEVDLIAPNGNSVRLLNSNSLLPFNESIVTVFDDQAPTPMANNTYTSFAPRINSLNNLNTIFSGSSSKGKWRLKIHDTQSGDTGRLYSWGIQFNNKVSLPKVVACTALLQGFYNPVSNTSLRDTISGYLRNFTSPYGLVDSSKAYFQTDGTGSLSFTGSNIQSGTGYILVLKHRNSIETWNNSSVSLIGFPALTSQGSFDFTTDSAKAYGNNLIRVDNSPVEYAIFGGDVNQDDVVEASDAGMVDNDAANFVTGYVNSDVTGDDVVDASDAALVDNNAFNFVIVIRP
jgi:subtilisin-like proprotein convertase family protein